MICSCLLSFIYFPQITSWDMAQDSFPTGSFLPKLPGMFLYFSNKKRSEESNELPDVPHDTILEQHLHFVSGNWGAMARSAYVSL